MHVRSQHKAVIEEIRGRSDEEILLIIEFMPYRVSYLKLVYSATENASHNMGFNEAN